MGEEDRGRRSVLEMREGVGRRRSRRRRWRRWGRKFGKKLGKKFRRNMLEEAVGEDKDPEGYSHQGRRIKGCSNMSSMSTATTALCGASAPHRLLLTGDPRRISPTRSPTETEIPHLSCRKVCGCALLLLPLPSFDLCSAPGCSNLV